MKHVTATALREAPAELLAAHVGLKMLLPGDMSMKKLVRGSAALIMGAAVASTAFADNPIGLYVGLGAGESTVRSDNNYNFDGYGGGCGYYFGADCGYDYSHHFAWKALIGVRPIPLVGAELDYFDFGHPGSDGSFSYYDNNYGPDSHPRAITAFGVGYLPLPLPFLDVFGKLGVARLHTNVNGFDGPVCSPNGGCPLDGVSPYSQSRWDTRFAYGVGLQTKFSNLAIRAEYERINSPYGDPDIFSVGASWTF